MNNYLINQDYMSGGVYRAYVIKRSDSRVFIPGLTNKNILDSNGDISNEEFERIKETLPKPLYNSEEIMKLLDDKPTPCFVAFENGNAKRPIVLAYFGKGVKSVPGSGGGSGSSFGNNGVFDANGMIISLTGNGDLLLVAGHGNGDSGASGNGYTEAELTRDFVNILAKKIKCDVFDTSKNMYQDLFGSTATEYLSNYKCVMEVHFNATPGASGSEILVGDKNAPNELERAILGALTSTGLKSRGFVDGTWLGNYNKCKAAGVPLYFLIEVCFIDSSTDMNHYITNKETIISNVAAIFNTLMSSTVNTNGTGGGGIVNTSTAIMGQAVATVEQMTKYLQKKNPSAPNYAQIYLNEGAFEGVRGDIAFAQSCQETGHWLFGGDVSASQNNFGGLGATGSGTNGNGFATPQIGIRAQIQHLKAYASIEPLKGTCVDNRFNYVTRGKATTIGGLGGTWAADTNYGNAIVKILNEILSM